MDRNSVQTEALTRILKYKGHGLLNLAPRVGKTKIAIDYLRNSMFNSALWVAPSSEIRDVDLPEEFAKWRAKTLFRKVKVVHWASLNKEDCKKYDIIILDEYHLITENNAKTLSGTKILGLSGTHPVEEDKLTLLNKLKLKIIYSLSIDKAVKFGIIAPYKINVIEYNLDNKKRNILAGSKKKKFYTTEQAQYDFWTSRIGRIRYSGKEVPKFMYLYRQRVLHTFPSRMEIARNVLSKLKGRTLIFTYQISQAEELCKDTYHSKTSDKAYNKFRDEKINRLSLVNMASVGTTFHNMDNCLIVGTNSKAKNFEQRFCRILIPRENYEAEVYIICALGTQDENWVKTALANLDPKNINYINYKNVENNL